MNVNDYGVVFLLGVGADLTAFTGLTLVFNKPDGTTLTVMSPAVTTSTSPVETPLGTFLPEQYALYTFQPGDVSVSGLWSVRLIYDAPGPIHLISNSTNFAVGP